MKVLTKEYILSLISEQQHMSDMDEMARDGRADLIKRVLDQPKSFDVPGVASVNPNTGQVEQDKVWSKTERETPNGQILYMFKDANQGGKDKLYEPDINKVHNQIPRNWKYGMAYNGPESLDKKVDKKITRLQKVQSTYGHKHDDPELRAVVGQNVVKQQNDTWAKRYVIHDAIQDFMGSASVAKHLDLCGIPNIIAGASFTEPITNIKPQYNYNGPNIHFAYHTTRDATDVQEYIDNIINVHTGDEFTYKQGQKMVRRHGGNVYPGGLWTPEQRAYSKNHFRETPVLKLPMKNVQRGEVGFNVVSDLVVMGQPVDSTYVLFLTLKFEIARRGANSEHVKSDKLLEPIKVTIRKEMPDKCDGTMRSCPEFFKELFKEGFRDMAGQIAQIQYDDVLTALAFEPDEVIADQPTN